MTTPTTTAPAVDTSTLDPVDISSLTLGELAYFERRSGISLASFGEDGTPVAGPLMVLVGIALFRTGAYPTPEAAQKAAEDVPMNEAERLILIKDKAPAQGE